MVGEKGEAFRLVQGGRKRRKGQLSGVRTDRPSEQTLDKHRSLVGCRSCPRRLVVSVKWEDAADTTSSRICDRCLSRVALMGAAY